MDDDEYVEDIDRPKFGWLGWMVIAIWLALWTIANIRTVQAEVVVTRSLNIDEISKCQMLSANKPGTYVWDFEHGCQLKINRRQK